MDHGQLIAHYRTQHVLVVPSFHETFGMVYAEALSQGVPVVYSRGEGFDGQFADGEVGFACDPRQPSSIASAIERVVGDYEALSVRALAGSQRFDWSRIADRYRELYQA